MTYLDANASEPARPQALAALLDAAALPGNPSSVHAAGRTARSRLESARRAIACAVGGASVVFTSGGTEADALAIRALGAGRRLLAGATEHAAVLANAPDAAILPVTPCGRIDLAALEAALRGGGPALVCLMLANNETGVLHPIARAAGLCRSHGALLHVDAAQALGRIPVDLPALGAHSLALSGHKLGGPQGAGAWALADAEEPAPMPIVAGGGQERGWRGGTPPLPAIAGFAAAVEAAGAALGDMARIAALRDRAEAAARAEGAIVCGEGAPRLPNTVCLALPGVAAERQLIALDLAGVQVSAGAACSSGRMAESHVLRAMGLGALAGQAIRVSLPWNAAEADAARFAGAYAAMARRAAGRAAC